VKDLIRQDHALSRRQLMSGLAGLGMSTVAVKALAQSSPAQPAMAPVMRPAPGQALVYDDFSVGGWPSPRWLKFRSAEYDFGTPRPWCARQAPPRIC
jgi:hypothetical protein